MVTMPSEAADNTSTHRGAARAGMNCMRINCAHDEENRWLTMIQHLAASEASGSGRSCQGLDGPGGPEAAHRADRARGRGSSMAAACAMRSERVTAARTRLAHGEREPPWHGADASVARPKAWLGRLSPERASRFVDARGADDGSYASSSMVADGALGGMRTRPLLPRPGYRAPGRSTRGPSEARRIRESDVPALEGRRSAAGGGHCSC